MKVSESFDHIEEFEKILGKETIEMGTFFRRP